MSNVKTIKTSNYVQLHNKAGLDKELSAKAKGILYTAMALPSDYEINKTTFHKFFQDGRDSIKAGIEELVLKGYGFHEQINKGGKFSAITLISDVKLTTLAKLDEDELETFVAEVSDELCYALQRIREEGTTYIGKLHNEAKKKKKEDTVTENPLRETVTENPLRKKRHGESVRNKEVGLRKYVKDFEEEEELTTLTKLDVINLMQTKMVERGITNEKTITAILATAHKCKAIGTPNVEAMENYVVKVLEEKMSKLGQGQREKKATSGTKRGNKAVRTELLPKWLEQDQGPIQPSTVDAVVVEEQRKQLEESLKAYKRA